MSLPSTSLPSPQIVSSSMAPMDSFDFDKAGLEDDMELVREVEGRVGRVVWELRFLNILLFFVVLGACGFGILLTLRYLMLINLFQNAKILEKKITQPPHAGFHPIFSQDPKDS